MFLIIFFKGLEGGKCRGGSLDAATPRLSYLVFAGARALDIGGPQSFSSLPSNGKTRVKRNIHDMILLEIVPTSQKREKIIAPPSPLSA